ncbi:hypothetical protein C8R42DRAFT_747627 [Lentinula raphanica]|nr:hypothetical protein C8R42DRAFT_747627 [Lentinula raphanica]
MEISFADELDELFADELWELGEELGTSESPGKEEWPTAEMVSGFSMIVKHWNTSLTSLRKKRKKRKDEQESNMAVITSQLRHFVIQEYILHPLLFDPREVPVGLESSKPNVLEGYKFHLRAYCVASGALTLYLYNRVLALFSSLPYTVPNASDSSTSTQADLAPHLTNTSLQTHRGEQGVRLLNELIGCHILSDGFEDHPILTLDDVDDFLSLLSGNPNRPLIVATGNVSFRSSDGVIFRLEHSSKNTTHAANGGGYMGQIADARACIAQGAAAEKQARMNLDMSTRELADFEAQFKKVEKDARNGKKRLETTQKALADAQKRLAACGWTEEKEQEGEARGGQLRTKVKGHVDRLVSIRPGESEKATALETAAGAQLYYVIIQDENVGKILLSEGVLKKRVTCVPLFKIRGFRIKDEKIAAAAQISQGKARPALDSLKYDPRLDNTIAHVFGGTFICEDVETAQKVTFDNRTNQRCVTLEEDIGILNKVQVLLDVEEKLATVEAQLNEHERTWNGDSTKRRREAFRNISKEIQIREHELKLAQEQNGETSGPSRYPQGNDRDADCCRRNHQEKAKGQLGRS